MALIKWEPFGELERFFDDDKFFTSPFRALGGGDMAVDVYEKDGNVIAEMQVPGMKPDDIDISVEDDHLRISGKREETQEEKKKDYYSKEIRRGSFERIIRLPSAVDEENAEANYDDGVLTVTLPKRESESRKPIKINIK